MSIKRLKKELKGSVLKKNRFLIELYVPGEDSSGLQVLCQDVAMPQRTIDTTTIHHKGRPFTLRGETNFGGSISLVFLENQTSDIRRMMDFWLVRVDNPELHKIGQEEKEAGGLAGLVQRGTKEISQQVSQVKDIKSIYKDFNQIMDFQSNSSAINQYPEYQTNVRIWQLNGSDKKVYGYELQNQFITGVQDGDFSQTSKNETQLVTISLSYSEITPLQGSQLSTVGRILGQDAQGAIQRTSSLF